MNSVELTNKLISIPSWVDLKTNEIEVGQFVFNYLRRFKWLKVCKQSVIGDRFNVVARDNYPTRLLVIGHIDTVQPRSGWITNLVKPVTKDGKIYGLGATDMKGGIAAILSTLDGINSTRGLMFLFYIDEEYDFLGTKKFINEYQNKIKPKFIISLDGSDLSLGLGCRGLIEIRFVVAGKSGHAAKPDDGLNAIDWSFAAINNLKKYLKRFSSKELGQTTINVAFFQGGLNLGRDKNGLIFGKEGNNIADVAEFIVDIRPASSALDAQKIVGNVKRFFNSQGLKLVGKEIRHDLSPWLTKKSKIKKISAIIDQEITEKYSFPANAGFIDIQFFWNCFKVPCLTFGPGSSAVAHKANEFIKINNLLNSEKILKKIIIKFGKNL